MPRLFVALEVPQEISNALQPLCRGLPGARWTDPAHLHLTMRFIGEVDHNTFCDIGEALAAVAMPPFELTLEGIGQFPLRGGLRHLWVGVQKSDELTRLKRRIDRFVVDAGIGARSAQIYAACDDCPFSLSTATRAVGGLACSTQQFSNRKFSGERL